MSDLKEQYRNDIQELARCGCICTQEMEEGSDSRICLACAAKKIMDRLGDYVSEAALEHYHYQLIKETETSDFVDASLI